MPTFPSRWVKIAWVITGTLLLVVLAVWIDVMWAVATSGG